MRIISQDGMTDLPYESVGVSINNLNETDIIAYPVIEDTSKNDYWILATYSTNEKAKEAVELLRDAYIGNEMCKIMSEIQRTICMTTIEDNQQERMYGIFRFPKEEEIK